MTGPKLVHNAIQTPPTRRGDDWRDQSVCREVDPELFFVPGNDGRAWENDVNAEQLEEVRAVCKPCPVVLACRLAALNPAARDNDGFRGGMTPTERVLWQRSEKRAGRWKETA